MYHAAIRLRGTALSCHPQQRGGQQAAISTLQRGRERLERAVAVLRTAHASESLSSTAFCPNVPCHRPGCSSLPVRVCFQQCSSLRPPLWLAKLSYSSPSHLKKQQHLLWLLGGNCFSRALPMQEDTYPCVLGIRPLRPSLRNISGLWCPYLLQGS